MKLVFQSFPARRLEYMWAANEVTMTAFSSRLGRNPNLEKSSKCHSETSTEKSKRRSCLARAVKSQLRTLGFANITCTMH
jgi:hypothetical protein